MPAHAPGHLQPGGSAQDRRIREVCGALLSDALRRRLFLPASIHSTAWRWLARMATASGGVPAFIGNPLAQGELGAGVLAHAYLLTGPRQVGKRTLAERFAAQVACGLGPDGRACGACALCRQAAVVAAEPDGGAHAEAVRLLGAHLVLVGSSGAATTRIGDVAAVQGFLALSPVQPGHKVAVFGRAETLSSDAANRLLKTLEEPPAHTVLVLCAPSPESEQNWGRLGGQLLRHG